ncbi:aldo/keto reductase [Paenibacillus sp. WLX1005]|uniref:aldo/keto reductase n=1 Tax=Paenibacillus sp. WLX1005 TaxID=3243766 RepID=UPI0039843525
MSVEAMMRRRPLGRTGLKIAPLSLGAAPLGQVYGQVDEQQGIRMVHQALDQGMNLIDTSPYYGITRSEQMLGQALDGVARDRYILCTKAGRYGDQEFDFSRERILSSVHESLQRLGTDYADIVLLHDIEFGDLRTVLDEGIPALQQLKQQGTIRYYGVSCLPLDGYRIVLEHTDLDVILSYCHYTLNDSTLVDLLPMLEQRGVGIMNAAPLSMGLLSDQGPASWHPASSQMRQLSLQAAVLCAEHGTSLPKLAVQYALSNPALTTTIVGTSSVEELTANLTYASEPINEVLLTKVLNLLRPIQGQSWATGHWTEEVLNGSHSLRWEGSPFHK